MGILELISKIRELRARRQEQREELPDDMTRDKYLRSLRRERRVQMESIEKENLKRDISEFNREHTRKNLFGIRGENKPITHQDFNILQGERRGRNEQKMRFI